jgi:hypothetical protein
VTAGVALRAPVERRGASPPRRRAGVDRWCLALAALSGALVALGRVLGWRGVDLPAQLYRVEQFRAHGFTLWDSQWYGGHWTLDYSVLYPPLAVLLSMTVLAVLSAVLATAAFDRLIVYGLGRRARLGSAVFAVSVIVSNSIGQLAFFTGEAFGLACLWALIAARRRWILAGVLAAASALCSPLAGAFVAVALVGWWAAAVWPRVRPEVEGSVRRLDSGPRWWKSGPDFGSARGLWRRGWSWLEVWRGEGWRLGAVTAAALVPIVASSALFPGQGPMPYPATDCLWEVIVAMLAWVLVPRGQHVLRTAVSFYVIALIGSELIPSAVGGNVGRMEDAFALPLAAGCCWVRRDGWGGVGYRVALGLAAVPLALSQWSPAWQALTSNAGQAWTSQGYYAPLVSWLRVHDAPASGPAGSGAVPARVEVVPTEDHWEAAYVAPSIPLARGWERQLDIADNPLFYGQAPLTAQTYLAWLEDNGARYVAVADEPLDEAGVAEARLIHAGVPGLRLAWHDADWQVYAVNGAPGIVSGAATLVDMAGDHLDLDATAVGSSVVRVRWAAHWTVVSGAARLAPAPGGWTTVQALRPGPIALRIRVLP